MLVYKFGGSILKDAGGIRRMAEVVRRAERPLIIVVSAFGKTTSALERTVALTWKTDLKGRGKTGPIISELKIYHEGIVAELFKDHPNRKKVLQKLGKLFRELGKEMVSLDSSSFEEWHDRIVSYGERFSSLVVFSFLKPDFPDIVHKDIRRIIVTDQHFGMAGVFWDKTARRVEQAFSSSGGLYLTQGYIARTQFKEAATLGREGSDYTAAILGSILHAEKVVLWKDVPGVMNADPKICSGAIHLPGISYQEAAEMTFYGAKVIHPKTIKPLRNKHIPLVVRGLYTPENPGTTIWDFEEMVRHVPVYIRKERQILLSVFPRDYSFVLNRHLEDLFGLFRKWRFNISLVQISAISVSFCIDDPGENFMERVKELQETFEVYFNRDAELLTFRHYTEEMMQDKLKGCVPLVSQRTRLTAQFVIKRVRRE